MADTKPTTFRIYRYNPEKDSRPYMQEYTLDVPPGMMLLDALLELKAQDETLSFRRSCGEGVCGSDGMNINGRGDDVSTADDVDESAPETKKDQ